VRESKLEGKSYDIPKRLVWDAWLKVKENGGAAGADGVTIEQFEEGLQGNLFKLWNRMASGSYFPGPVRAVEIPKKDRKGGMRVLGIPNVADRIAQAAVAMALEPGVEPVFTRTPTATAPGERPWMRSRSAESGAGRTTGSSTSTSGRSSTPFHKTSC